MSKYKMLHGSLKIASDQTVAAGQVVELDDAFVAHLGAELFEKQKSEAKPAPSTSKPEAK